VTQDNLNRLFRSAANAPGEPAPEAPFGFDTRVVASWRSNPRGVDEFVELTRFLRRAGVVAFAVLVLAGGAAYNQFREQATFAAPQTNEYAIADSAIQTEFGQ
jgi:hypothetical protein